MSGNDVVHIQILIHRTLCTVIVVAVIDSLLNFFSDRPMFSSAEFSSEELTEQHPQNKCECDDDAPFEIRKVEEDTTDDDEPERRPTHFVIVFGNLL